MRYLELHAGQRFTFVDGGAECIKIDEFLYVGPGGYPATVGNTSAIVHPIN